MAKYYEEYKILLLMTTLMGVYVPSIEKVYGGRWYVKLLKVLVIVPGVIYPVYLVSAIKYQIFDDDEVGNKIYGGAVLQYIGSMSFTFFALCYYKNDFIRLFELWDTMFQEDMYPDDRKVLLQKNKKHTNKWLVSTLTAMNIGSVLYCIAVYFKPDKKLNHPSGFPYKHEWPDFEMLNTLDLLVCIFGFGIMVVFDSTTMTFLSMEEAQLIHLKRSLATIVDTISVTEEGNIKIKDLPDSQSDGWKIRMASDEVEKKMRIWILHHHQLIRFHNEFRKVFTIPLCFKFALFVLLICFMCILTLAGKFTILELVFANMICLLNYIVFYVNIKYADTILEVAATIFEDAFEKSWYLYPKKITDAFHIIQMNSYRPLSYLAFKKYTLCSNSFLKILTSAYSLFTCLLQTNRKKLKSLDLRNSRNL